MPNANLVVWVTDWHCVSDNAEAAGIGIPTTPAKAAAVVAHINTLDPVGCFDTGDNKDHYGTDGTEDEHDNYIDIIQNGLTWMPLNPGDGNATFPNLPGNHDELYPETETGTGNNDFSTTYDVKFWGPPYHWTFDWEAPKIRFIGFHSYMHHTGTAYGTGPTSIDAQGIAHITSIEQAWLENELNTLPERWQAIPCSHFPIAELMGNNIKYTDDNFNYSDTPLNDMLDEHASKIVCVFSGHRHQNYLSFVQGNITHITTGGVSYGGGNGFGSFVPITYIPADRTITLDLRYARSPFEQFVGFTPVTFQLQPHRLFFART